MTGTNAESISRVPLATQVYEKVRAAILTGELAEDSELNQVALARQFGVSTIPVREAIRQLQADGLVASVPYQRARVRSLSIEQLAELLEIREELEVVGMRRHALHLDDDELTAVEALNERLARTEDGREWLQGDWELHTRLLGGSTATADVVDGVRRRIHSALNSVTSTTTRHNQAVEEHRAILAALRAGDEARAVEALRHHIHRTAGVLLETFEQRFDGS